MRVVASLLLLLTFTPRLGLGQRRIETGFLDRSIELHGQTYRYQVYIPDDYTPARSWPLVMDLHGNSWQGTDGLFHTAVGLANRVRRARSSFPVIGVFPQAQPGTRWLHPEMQDMAVAQLEQTMREFNVDSARTYLTGFSMGAVGAYRFAYRWPDKFAAIVAIAGRVETALTYPAEAIESDRRANPFVAAPNPFEGLSERIKHLPIWIFHGESDKTVPVDQSRRLVPALKVAGANVRYTEYPDTTHVGGAEKAYADPEMIKWLLAQRRK